MAIFFGHSTFCFFSPVQFKIGKRWLHVARCFCYELVNIWICLETPAWQCVMLAIRLFRTRFWRFINSKIKWTEQKVGFSKCVIWNESSTIWLICCLLFYFCFAHKRNYLGDCVLAICVCFFFFCFSYCVFALVNVYAYLMIGCANYVRPTACAPHFICHLSVAFSFSPETSSLAII